MDFLPFAAGMVIPLLSLTAVGCKPNSEVQNPGHPSLSASSASRINSDSTKMEAGRLYSGHENTAKQQEDAASIINANAAPLISEQGLWADSRISFYQKWGKVHPKAAIDHARANNPGASTLCIGAVLSSWLEVDSGAVFDWLRAQPANAERSIWLGRLIDQGKSDTLEKSLALAVDGYNSPAGKITLARGVRQMFSQHDGIGERANEWLESTFPQKSEREIIIKTVLEEWVQSDAAAASEWLNTLPRTVEWRDDAVAAFVRSIISTDPESGIVWAESVKNETIKVALLKEISVNGTEK